MDRNFIDIFRRFAHFDDAHVDKMLIEGVYLFSQTSVQQMVKLCKYSYELSDLSSMCRRSSSSYGVCSVVTAAGTAISGRRRHGSRLQCVRLDRRHGLSAIVVKSLIAT